MFNIIETFFFSLPFQIKMQTNVFLRNLTIFQLIVNSVATVNSTVRKETNLREENLSVGRVKFYSHAQLPLPQRRGIKHNMQRGERVSDDTQGSTDLSWAREWERRKCEWRRNRHTGRNIVDNNQSMGSSEGEEKEKAAMVTCPRSKKVIHQIRG